MLRKVSFTHLSKIFRWFLFSKKPNLTSIRHLYTVVVVVVSMLNHEREHIMNMNLQMFRKKFCKFNVPDHAWTFLIFLDLRTIKGIHGTVGQTVLNGEWLLGRTPKNVWARTQFIQLVFHFETWNYALNAPESFSWSFLTISVHLRPS